MIKKQIYLIMCLFVLLLFPSCTLVSSNISTNDTIYMDEAGVDIAIFQTAIHANSNGYKFFSLLANALFD